MARKRKKSSDEPNTVIEEITPSKPKKQAVVARPAPVEAERQLPQVPLRHFVLVSGKKPDQIQPFERWARKHLQHATMTVPEWHAKLKEFLERPAGIRR